MTGRSRRPVQETGESPRTSEPLQRALNPEYLGDASDHPRQKRNPQIPRVRCTGGQTGRPRREGTQRPGPLNPLSRPVEAGSHQLPRGPAIAHTRTAGVGTHPVQSSRTRCPVSQCLLAGSGVRGGDLKGTGRPWWEGGDPQPRSGY